MGKSSFSVPSAHIGSRCSELLVMPAGGGHIKVTENLMSTQPEPSANLTEMMTAACSAMLALPMAGMWREARQRAHPRRAHCCSA